MVKPAIRLAFAFCLSMATTRAVAQAWDSPTFFAPRPGEDVGLYVTSPEGRDWGIAGIWRQEGNLDLGVRAGLADGSDFQLGIELYGPLRLAPESGLLVDWWLGAGGTFSDLFHLRIPVGLSAGIRIGTTEGMQIKPYVLPRLAFDGFTRDNGGDDTVTEFNFDLDIGADVALGESFVFRTGFTLGALTAASRRNQNTFGAGIAYRVPRRVIVR